MMSTKRVKTRQMESVRLQISEHMTSVGEEMLSVLEEQQPKLNVRVFVLERLGAAAEFMCNLFHTEMETLETLLQRDNKVLDLMLQPVVQLHRAGWLICYFY